MLPIIHSDRDVLSLNQSADRPHYQSLVWNKRAPIDPRHFSMSFLFELNYCNYLGTEEVFNRIARTSTNTRALSQVALHILPVVSGGRVWSIYLISLGHIHAIG